MFNVTVKGNIRCNGLIPMSGSMVKQDNRNDAILSANCSEPTTTTMPDLSPKIKFANRLKTYLTTSANNVRTNSIPPPSSSGTRNESVDDPYTFNDADVKQQPVLVKTNKSESVKKNRFLPNVSLNHHHFNGDDDVVMNVSGNGDRTMMHRLQTQIARNKVTVKHNDDDNNSRHCLSEQKHDKNHFVHKNIKHSIIGLINNVECNNRFQEYQQQNVLLSGRRMAISVGKPLPSHLRARRINAKQQQQQQQEYSTLTSKWHAPESLTSTSDVDETNSTPIYQRHWFSKELELLSIAEGHREVRLELTRTELKRQLLQMRKSGVGQQQNNLATAASIQRFMSNALRTTIGRTRRKPTINTNNNNNKRNTLSKSNSNNSLMKNRSCEYEQCSRAALPCTKHCTMHIMQNVDQVLFDHCTAKFSDNTQCSVPVFDIAHALPLCVEHARKRDNYNKMLLETKPKKPRRKIKPSAMIRPQKRNKKRKKLQQKNNTTANVVGIADNNHITELNVCETSSPCEESSEEMALGTLSESEYVTTTTTSSSTTITTTTTTTTTNIKDHHHIGEQDVVEQVLAMQDEVGGDLELVVEQTLVTQASRLLEETDFTNVLNQIPADEFNDLFAVDRNGVYEPSREETEELERALEAVDEDVKSLEKLSRTQGLLDSLLDEHTLVESLVQIPDVFHNGYTASGTNSAAAAGTSIQIVDNYHHHHHHHHAVAALHIVDGMLPVQTHTHTPS